MYHLLPLAEKRLLLSEYKTRFLIVSLVALLVLILLGIVFLLPSLFLADAKNQAVNSRIKILKDTVLSKQDSTISTIFESTKSDLKLLTSGQDSLSLRTLLETIINDRISGISIRSFSFSRIEADGSILATIKGVYTERDSLVAFRKSLEREKIFNRVDLPISSLAKSKNADFTIELVASEPKK